MRSRERGNALLLATIGLIGCATASGTATDTRKARSSDNLIEVPSSKEGKLYVDPTRSLGAYDDWIISEIGIHYAPEQRKLSKREQMRIYQIMADALRDDLTDRGQTVVDEPGPCTLGLALYLTSLQLYESEQPEAQSQSSFVQSYGSFSVIAEFRDSLTNAPLARYGEHRGLGSGVQEGPVRPDLDRLRTTLHAVLDDMGERLREPVRALKGADLADRGCDGRLGALDAAQKNSESEPP